MNAILSHSQMLVGKPPYAEPDPVIGRKQAFERQFQHSLQQVANAIVVHWNLRDEKRKEPFRYHYSPGAYKYKDAWLQPYLEELIGPKADAVKHIQEAFQAAFPDYKIVVEELKSSSLPAWNFRVDIHYDL